MTSLVKLFVTLGSFLLMTSQMMAQSSDLVDRGVIGYVRVFFEHSEPFHIVIDHDFENVYTIATGDSIPVPIGNHHFRFIKNQYADQTAVLPIVSEQTISWQILTSRLTKRIESQQKSSYARLHWGVPVMIVTESVATLVRNGFALNSYYAGVALGDSAIFQARYQQRLYEQIRIASDPMIPFSVYQLHFRPDRGIAYSWAVLPGAAQIYKNQHAKGTLILGLALIAGGLSIEFIFSV